LYLQFLEHSSLKSPQAHISGLGSLHSGQLSSQLQSSGRLQNSTNLPFSLYQMLRSFLEVLVRVEVVLPFLPFRPVLPDFGFSTKWYSKTYPINPMQKPKHKFSKTIFTYVTENLLFLWRNLCNYRIMHCIDQEALESQCLKIVPSVDQGDRDNFSSCERLYRIVKDGCTIFNVTSAPLRTDLEFCIRPIEDKTPLGSEFFVSKYVVRPAFLHFIYAMVFLLEESVVRPLLGRTGHSTIQRLTGMGLNLTPLVLRNQLSYCLVNNLRSLVMSIELWVTNIGQCNRIAPKMCGHPEFELRAVSLSHKPTLTSCLEQLFKVW